MHCNVPAFIYSSINLKSFPEKELVSFRKCKLRLNLQKKEEESFRLVYGGAWRASKVKYHPLKLCDIIVFENYSSFPHHTKARTFEDSSDITVSSHSLRDKSSVASGLELNLNVGGSNETTGSPIGRSLNNSVEKLKSPFLC
ncbi:hypothetical protein TNCV_5048211 [Trichonephila clavipes]|nr:hypothetical protein TNCV_5048211 [Trichonephila clavipes]